MNAPATLLPVQTPGQRAALQAPPLTRCGLVAVEPSRNFIWLKRLVTTTELYPFIGDDASPPADGFETRGFEADALLLRVTLDGAPVGAFVFIPIAFGWEVHTALTRHCRGARALEAGRQGIAFIFQHTEARRITSRCPEDNPASLWYALRCGFEITSRQADWVKAGRRYNSVYVELNRSKWKGSRLCRSQP